MFCRFGEEDYKRLIEKSKYSIEIVDVLFSCGTITHTELSNKLKIKKNNLSNIVKKLEPFEIFFVRRIGKNVYYSLNSKGFEFYNYKQEQFAEESKNDFINDTQLVFSK